MGLSFRAVTRVERRTPFGIRDPRRFLIVGLGLGLAALAIGVAAPVVPLAILAMTELPIVGIMGLALAGSMLSPLSLEIRDDGFVIETARGFEIVPWSQIRDIRFARSNRSVTFALELDAGPRAIHVMPYPLDQLDSFAAAAQTRRQLSSTA